MGKYTKSLFLALAVFLAIGGPISSWELFESGFIGNEAVYKILAVGSYVSALSLSWLCLYPGMKMEEVDLEPAGAAEIPHEEIAKEPEAPIQEEDEGECWVIDVPQEGGSSDSVEEEKAEEGSDTEVPEWYGMFARERTISFDDD